MIVFLGLLLSGNANAMTEDEYWDTYAERMIEGSKVCEEEAEKNGSFNNEVYSACFDAWGKLNKIKLEMIEKRKADRCASVRARIESTKGQSAGSDSANFLMGMLNAYMEDEACY